MTITKEQFQTFQQHFTVTEVARARVEANAEINFDDFKEYQNDPDTFFVDTIWNQDLPGEIVKSEGYYIRHVSTNDFIKQISGINDVTAFIENNMDAYLAEHQQKGQNMTNLNDTIDVLFERLNTPRAIFDEVATRTNLIPVAEELKDHPKDMKAILNAFHKYEYFDNMGSIVKNLGLKDKYPKTYQFFCELSDEEIMDGDYSIKGEYYPAGISDLQEWLSEHLANAFMNSPYVKNTDKYTRFVYNCRLTSTDEEGGFDNDGLLVTILNGDNYEYITVDETDLPNVRNTYDVIKAIDDAAKAKPLEKATLTSDAREYYNALANHVEDGIELSNIELKFLKRELKKGN